MLDMLIGSTLSALATGFGAIPILFIKNLSHKWRDILLAFSAGVMVSASAFGLMPEALNESSIYLVMLGVLFGVFLLNALEKNIPHIDVENMKNTSIKIDSKSLLIILALLLHNIPEGASVGISYTTSNQELGSLIAFSIAAQNLPEGLIVALFLLQSNLNKWASLGIATLTGIVEIFSAIAGYSFANFFAKFGGFGLAIAAGSMLFIVYKELFPESHGHGYERQATYSFVIGLLFMFYLTNL